MVSKQLSAKVEDESIRSCELEVKEDSNVDAEPCLKKVKTESQVAAEDEMVKSANIEVKEDNCIEEESLPIADDSDFDDKYKKSTFGKMLEDSRDDSSRFWSSKGQKEFKTRFTVKFPEYLEIVRRALEMIGNSDEASSCLGDIKVPLEIKILGSLRLSKSTMEYDDIHELSGMSVKTIDSFHNTFWKLYCGKHNMKWIKHEEEDDDF